MHLLAAFRLEAHHGQGVEALGLQARMLADVVGILIRFDSRAEIRGGEIKVFVELYDEILLETFFHTPGIAACVASHLPACGVNLHRRTSLVSVDAHITVGIGEGEAEDARAVRRREFRQYIVVGQIDAVVVGACHFCLV